MSNKDDIHTVAGKREFFKNFLNSVRDELIANADKMPEDWDGHELRWMVTDKFTYEQHNRPSRDAGWRRRVREYNNERIVRNL